MEEAATAAEVRREMEKEQEEEVEDQVSNGKPDDYSFCSTECSSFVLCYRQNHQLVVIVDDITVSSKQHLSLYITISPNRWAHLLEC